MSVKSDGSDERFDSLEAIHNMYSPRTRRNTTFNSVTSGSPQDIVKSLKFEEIEGVDCSAENINDSPIAVLTPSNLLIGNRDGTYLGIREDQATYHLLTSFQSGFYDTYISIYLLAKHPITRIILTRLLLMAILVLIMSSTCWILRPEPVGGSCSCGLRGSAESDRNRLAVWMSRSKLVRQVFELNGRKGRQSESRRGVVVELWSYIQIKLTDSVRSTEVCDNW